MANVLVVDDDPDMRAVMMEALEGAGHETYSAANGQEGVRYAMAVELDLVIVDIFMPVQEGLETIRQLRRRAPRLPILAISGRNKASSPMLTVALQIGAVNVLEKPFDAQTLRAAVEATLETRGHSKPPEVLANQTAGPILPQSD
jgi:DNA-binding response OmpR family regulator